MPSTPPPFYISTAIPFVNARPHLGFALELCIADVLARHARARGHGVCFLTGSDDHSLKNVLAAERASVPTATFVREHSEEFRQLSAALGVSYDAFVSTSRHPDHPACVAELWRRCRARGDLYQQSYSGLYCVGCERFCEPGETRCTEHSAPLEHVSELNWFFRLSNYTERLRRRIQDGELRITPASAREETLALVREPLPDLCVSRSATRARGWGVPVPDDAEQVIWVWFDALAYYLTGLGFGGADPSRFERFWGPGARRVHVIGKGITRFHALIWPAILSSAGIAGPTDLLVHGYLTQAGAKISKSGVALDPQPLIAELGPDALRYYLLRHVRTTRDGDFSRERLVSAYNAELANDLGNLANRVFGLVARSGGVIPRRGDADPLALELQQLTAALPALIDCALERFLVDEALDAIFAAIAACNRYIDRTAPWASLKRGQTAQADAVLRTALEALGVVSEEIEPFLPATAARLSAALGPYEQSSAGFYRLREQQALPPSLQLFPRIESAVAASGG